ncbi:MAG: ferric reductase-like transmembrane domain-containing protein [Phycisphaeraceae bacterium]|nr:MAG: ferric reductase-like transmembrane domain-containing protein [Phycisphaeraceae bacterium]
MRRRPYDAGPSACARRAVVRPPAGACRAARIHLPGGRGVTNRFVWVSWNRHKRVYDGVLVGAIVLYLVLFVVGTFVFSADEPDPAVMLIHATGSLALVLLHVILCIGPLARLSTRFAPLLYNRRHFGVTMFLVALVHAVLVLGYYGGFGNTNPVHAVLFEGRSFASLDAFPYELLGLAGLVVLFVMAATSHDFWLDTLSPRVWKSIHMAVYPAYALLVAHVALGALRDDPVSSWRGLRGVLLSVGVATVGGLHLVAGLREMLRDTTGWKPQSPEEGDDQGEWLEVGSVDDIPEGRAKVVCLADRERVAVFNHDGKISAISNVCAHQAGPLGEGKVVDGCVTCPWHGYQYLPHNGQSPPPYSERVPTYRVRVLGRAILLDPRPLPPGTPVEPAFFEASARDESLFEESIPPSDLINLPPAPREARREGNGHG